MTDSDNNPDGHKLPDHSQKARTSELAAKIKLAQDARLAQATPDADEQENGSMMARGFRIGTEFVAAILVGTGIGFVIDEIAGTRPWALLIMFMIGFAAGILNVTRVVAEFNAQSAASIKDVDNAD